MMDDTPPENLGLGAGTIFEAGHLITATSRIRIWLA